MMICDNAIFFMVRFLLLFIRSKASIRSYKFENELGSTVVLPPCLSILSSSVNANTTILFKSDSGELLTMNGRLVSANPRFILKNPQSSILLIKSVESTDEGQYECRTDEIINYSVHLIVINLTTVHLTVVEGSNVTLQCAEKGVWIIEESHRGGPIRTQYTTDLILNNIQRDDDRFRKIVCSMFDGHDKREYIIDVIYKPTVKLLMSVTGRLTCTICARPIPSRIQWWWNGRKGRDDDIHQTIINQSCMAQQSTSVVTEIDYDTKQMIICEAENTLGMDQDIFEQERIPTTRNREYTTQITSIIVPYHFWTATVSMTNGSPSAHRTFLPLLMSFLGVLLK